MKKLHTILLAAVLVLAPQFSYAYKVVDSHITYVSPTVTMYTLEFEFGFANADMWMPIAASKTVKEGGNTTSSVILSTTTIQGNKYYVPMKEDARFTLLVLEQHEMGRSNNKVTVDRLPVTLQRTTDKESFVRVFEGEELKDFVVE